MSKAHIKCTFYFLVLIVSLLLTPNISAQSEMGENPYGAINPLAPKPLADYEELIGKCNCKSVSRNQDGSWADTVLMTWTFRYIMDGMAVQDETIKEDGRHSGSIRQYNPDSSQWYVHYYSSASASSILPAWEGEKNETGDIILYRAQKAPTGQEGYYRITFSDISKEGFNWLGEWVNTTETFSYPTWKIFCIKEE